MDILEKVKTTIKEYKLIQPGDVILAAVSGGPDSLALLTILNRLQIEFNYRLHVVHLNHKLRREADAEAEFVRQYAEQSSIPVTILEKDISCLLDSEGGSLQEVAREVRYELFSQVASEVMATKIALGHHADDLAETIIMRFLRGSGLEGLVGFTAQSRGNLIRPLIHVTREEIVDFCAQAGLSPCYDKSNMKTVYLRNLIRLELLPQLEEDYNPNLRQQLVQMSHLLNEENMFLEEYAAESYREVLIEERSNVIIFNIKLLAAKKTAIIRRIIRIGMEKLKGDKKNIYYHHYIGMQDLILNGSPGKMFYLPDGYILYRGYTKLQLGKRTELLHNSFTEYRLSIPGQVYLEELDIMLNAELLEGKVLVKGEQAAVDADLLDDEVIVRARKPGDYFYPLGLQGRKKVKDFLIDQKIDRLERDVIPIITTIQDDIIWIGGHRLDDRYKVDTTTKKTCIFTILKEGNEDA